MTAENVQWVRLDFTRLKLPNENSNRSAMAPIFGDPGKIDAGNTGRSFTDPECKIDHPNVFDQLETMVSKNVQDFHDSMTFRRKFDLPNAFHQFLKVALANAVHRSKSILNLLFTRLRGFIVRKTA